MEKSSTQQDGIAGPDYDGGEPLLQVRDLQTNVYTRQGVLKVVNRVNFDLRPGETLGIVGESGSGKSMTAKSIMRMVPKPAARVVGGQVMYHGADLLGISEKEMRKVRRNGISMILQDPQTSLNPVFSIGNQVGEGIRLNDKDYTKSTLKPRIVDLLRKVSIADPEKRVNDYPHQMSGGMKQRVVGAIALTGKPDIIIADEPTTSLDLTIQAQYLRLLKAIQRETGAAIIFITHDFGIVAKMCDRIAVMYYGSIVESGSIRSVFNNPSHPYTNGLIASVPAVERRVQSLYSIPGQPPALGEIRQGCPFAERCEFVDQRCRETHPPVFQGLSKDQDHAAICWRLEDPKWKPNLSSK